MFANLLSLNEYQCPLKNNYCVFCELNNFCFICIYGISEVSISKSKTKWDDWDSFKMDTITERMVNQPVSVKSSNGSDYNQAEAWSGSEHIRQWSVSGWKQLFIPCEWHITTDIRTQENRNNFQLVPAPSSFCLNGSTSHRCWAVFKLMNPIRPACWVFTAATCNNYFVAIRILNEYESVTSRFNMHFVELAKRMRQLTPLFSI